MKLFGVLACVGLAAASVSGWGAEASFDRTVTVSGTADLTVSTGSGTIHLTKGPEGRIHIVGHVRSSWGGSEERVREIAAHPPIEQTGDIVRVGGHQEDMRNISIDYEVEAPAGAFLDAAAGSGDVTDDDVGMNAKLHTGSGKIHATGLRGSFAVTTGSGSIYAEQSSEGDVKAETGSGAIELRNLHGALRAQTGSGGIKAQGAPAGPWRLTTGSGDVEIWTGGAGVTLDAGTGSGSIHSDREIAIQGTQGKHHVMGRIGGGGAAVKIDTGSGDIGIH